MAVALLETAMAKQKGEHKEGMVALIQMLPNRTANSKLELLGGEAHK